MFIVGVRFIFVDIQLICLSSKEQRDINANTMAWSTSGDMHIPLVAEEMNSI